LNTLIDKLKGCWTSIEEVEVLDYDSNFSNWIGEIPVSGIFRFELKKIQDENYQCEVKIPISSDRYFARYSGRFEKKRNKILIWQNEKVPVEIPYKLKNEILELKLFDKKILFEKEI